MKFLTIMIITLASLNAFSGNYNYKHQGINLCMTKTTYGDQVIDALEALKCVIPIAKDSVSDRVRFEVFTKINKKVRNAIRVVDASQSLLDVRVRKSIGHVKVAYCEIEEQLGELEEAPNREAVINEILMAGVEILVALNEECD
ncbi:MAG: hypothetical protein HOO06_07880 [Bdellovibrionaceae bacterium]|jgi:hypothetical protein|nr:hypothetical protein [Pseudobdellovibrionaceae bacterium]